METIKINPFLALFATLALISLLFFSVPIINILTSIDGSSYLEAIKDRDITDSIILTFKVSLWATLFIIIVGLPLGYILARYDFAFKSILEAIIDIPVMIPHTAAGIALLGVFGEEYFGGKFFSFFGIEFLGTEQGIMIAMMFLSAPYLINSAKDGFRKVDIKLEAVARTLGSNQFKTFFVITLPLARKDIINGSIMMWARGLGEFGAVVILAYHPMVTPVLIYDRFTSYGLTEASSISALMILVSIIIIAILRFLNNRF